LMDIISECNMSALHIVEPSPGSLDREKLRGRVLQAKNSIEVLLLLRIAEGAPGTPTDSQLWQAYFVEAKTNHSTL